MLRFGSVCSGIEAASVAWEPLGWSPQFYSEIEPFPCAVLHEHWSSGRPRFMPDPDEPSLSNDDRKARRAAIKSVSRLPEQANGVPNFGDMTQFEEWPDATIDVLVGGTPCQSFSVAGLREGLDDPRGDLMLTYVAIARRYRPRWVVWENVFGVLSSNGGRDFASLLGLLSGRRIEVPAGGWRTSGIVEGYERAYGLSWRVFDTQFVRVDGAPRALPQRRRRVFVIGHSGGDWRRAAAVLLERSGLSGDPAPRREAGKGAAPTIAASTRGGGGLGTDFDLDGGLTTVSHDPACTLTARDRKGPLPEADLSTIVAHSLRAEGFDASEDGTGRGTPLVPVSVAIRGRDEGGAIEMGDDVAHALRASQGGGDKPHVLAPIAFSAKDHGGDASVGVSPTLRAMGHGESHPNAGGQVAIAFDTTQITSKENRSNPKAGDPCHTLHAGAHPPALAIQAGALRENPSSGPDGLGVREGDAFTIEARAEVQAVQTEWAVRRLTPTECARLQGFSDHHCRIPWRGKPAEQCPDGPQYKAYGNSMSTNVMRWIGERIQFVDQIEPAA